MGSTSDTAVAAAEKLRAERSLRPLQKSEAGTPVRDLPDGVYGFTYSPTFESTPLFAHKSYRSFEFHKLANGAVEVVGYLTAEDAQRLAAPDAGRVALYPEPWQNAHQLGWVSLNRVSRSTKSPAREDGCPYRIELRAR